jgi:hypothetical protein
MWCTDEGETIARYAGKFDKDLVAAGRESQTSVHRNGGRAREWKQDRFPKGRPGLGGYVYGGRWWWRSASSDLTLEILKQGCESGPRAAEVATLQCLGLQGINKFQSAHTAVLCGTIGVNSARRSV